MAPQARFQIRFSFGVDSAVVQGAHVVVWVDALPSSDIDPLTIAGPAAIVSGSPAAREELAAWILELQTRLGDRAIVAVVAAGGPDAAFAVEDFVAAGSVIDALADLGLDYSSPEAAAAGGAWSALHRAGAHVLSASTAGQELLAAGGSLDEALTQWREPGIRVLREFTPA